MPYCNNDFFLCLVLFVVQYKYPEYIHIIYVYIGFLGQGIHFRGFFLSRGGHDPMVVINGQSSFTAKIGMLHV